MVDTYCVMMSVVAAPAGTALANESLSYVRSARGVCSLLQLQVCFNSWAGRLHTQSLVIQLVSGLCPPNLDLLWGP